MSHANERQQAIEKLATLLSDMRIAMLTTTTSGGHLRSRPMVSAQTEFQGDLWFFTEADAVKVQECLSHPQVSVSYAEPATDRFISISGKAQIVQNTQKVELLWRPEFARWFPDGTQPADLALLRVEVEEAEYWNGSQRSMVGLLKRLFASDSEVDEHAKVGWNG